MKELERLIWQRLSENSYIDYPFEGDYDVEKKGVSVYLGAKNDGVLKKGAAFTHGMIFCPLCDRSDSSDGLYKFLTERYVIRYLGAGGEFTKVEDRYVMDMSARDGDAVYHTVISNRDGVPADAGERWKMLTPMRWLARTLGSIRENEYGLYFDDRYESRAEWAYLQTDWAYASGLDDPLERSEDGWIWRSLFERAFESDFDDPIALTYGLRILRWMYEMKFVATSDGLRLRGTTLGSARFKALMDRTGQWTWFRRQVEEIRGRQNEAVGHGAVAGIKDVVGGA